MIYSLASKQQVFKFGMTVFQLFYEIKLKSYKFKVLAFLKPAVIQKPFVYADQFSLKFSNTNLTSTESFCADKTLDFRGSLLLTKKLIHQLYSTRSNTLTSATFPLNSCFCFAPYFCCFDQTNSMYTYALMENHQGLNLEISSKIYEAFFIY